MARVSMKDLLEAGSHFGHLTRRWNPKMKSYIYGERNGIHIIDLHQTLKGVEGACDFLYETVLNGGTVLFVGTKKQAQESIKEAASQSGQYFIANRWLGGMLTNFETIRESIKKLKNLREMDRQGMLERRPKKEAAQMRDLADKLERNLGGIEDMPGMPSAVFLIDVKEEYIAVREAKKLKIPVVAIVDTNCDPDDADYVIPGNDDAIRAIKLITSTVCETIIEALMAREQGIADGNVRVGMADQVRRLRHDLDERLLPGGLQDDDDDEEVEDEAGEGESEEDAAATAETEADAEEADAEPDAAEDAASDDGDHEAVAEDEAKADAADANAAE